MCIRDRFVINIFVVLSAFVSCTKVFCGVFEHPLQQLGALNLLLSNHAGVEVDVAEARLGPVAGHKDRGGAAFLDALLVSVWERVHFCAHADFAGVVGSRVVVDVAKLVKVVCVLLGFFDELFGVLPNRAVVLALSLLFLRQRLLTVVVLFAAEAPQLDTVDALVVLSKQIAAAKSNLGAAKEGKAEAEDDLVKLTLA